MEAQIKLAAKLSNNYQLLLYHNKPNLLPWHSHTKTRKRNSLCWAKHHWPPKSANLPQNSNVRETHTYHCLGCLSKTCLRRIWIEKWCVCLVFHVPSSRSWSSRGWLAAPVRKKVNNLQKKHKDSYQRTLSQKLSFSTKAKRAATQFWVKRFPVYSQYRIFISRAFAFSSQESRAQNTLPRQSPNVWYNKPKLVGISSTIRRSYKKQLQGIPKLVVVGTKRTCMMRVEDQAQNLHPDGPVMFQLIPRHRVWETYNL